MSFLIDWYPWLKAFHVIAVIAWMAGLFYLPRLFVHHAEKAPPGSELSETFKEMERKLYRLIMQPAMIAAWIFGLLTLASLGWDFLVQSPWLMVKLVGVVLMTVFHEACGSWLKTFAADANTRPGRFYRLANEVPTLLMILIVIMAVAEPF